MLEYLELIIIIILILLLLKPDYIRQMARSLGEAVAEFKGSKPSSLPSDKELVWIAEVLGIDVKGKTTSQIKKEIIEKLSST